MKFLAIIVTVVAILSTTAIINIKALADSVSQFDMHGGIDEHYDL